MDAPSVFISILNWNNAEKTVDCIKSLEPEIKQCAAKTEICVIDNGSELDDYLKLHSEVKNKNINLMRLDDNLGFTGGHNISIVRAIESEYKYIWLLNNDATVDTGCLAMLIAAMEEDKGCGAVSPVIRPEDGGEPVVAWGGLHEWGTRTTVWFKTEFESIQAHCHRPDEIIVAGTAILLRTASLKETGGLDDRLFAYCDDGDLGARLAKHGWRSKVVFSAAIEHGWRTPEHVPTYAIYLLYRNEMIFWYTHAREEQRRLLWLKLINESIYSAIQLKQGNLEGQSDAALLGIWDFIFKKHGRPDLARKPSIFIKLASRISEILNR